MGWGAIVGIIADAILNRNRPQVYYYHYTTAENANRIFDSGSIGGLRFGKTFYTDTLYTDGQTAQAMLALPNLPDVVIRFPAYNLTGRGPRGPYPVAQKYGQPGGGREYYTLGSIPIWRAIIIPLE